MLRTKGAFQAFSVVYEKVKEGVNSKLFTKQSPEASKSEKE